MTDKSKPAPDPMVSEIATALLPRIQALILAAVAEAGDQLEQSGQATARSTIEIAQRAREGAKSPLEVPSDIVLGPDLLAALVALEVSGRLTEEVVMPLAAKGVREALPVRAQAASRAALGFAAGYLTGRGGLDTALGIRRDPDAWYEALGERRRGSA